jgi:AraC-like DNA-binding protein
MGAQTFKGPDQFANLLRYRNAAWNWQMVCSIIILLSFCGEIFVNIELRSGLALVESWSLLIITLLKTALLVFVLFSIMTRSTRFEWIYVFGQSRYGKTPTTLTAAEYFHEIEGFKRLLNEEKVHLEENTSLETVAAKLGTTERHLSEAINLNWGESFSKVMNRQRIVEAQKLLLDYPDMRVSDILYQSGFRNKSAFNHEFRAFTSMSPTAFRKSNVKS